MAVREILHEGGPVAGSADVRGPVYANIGD